MDPIIFRTSMLGACITMNSAKSRWQGSYSHSYSLSLWSFTIITIIIIFIMIIIPIATITIIHHPSSITHHASIIHHHIINLDSSIRQSFIVFYWNHHHPYSKVNYFVVQDPTQKIAWGWVPQQLSRFGENPRGGWGVQQRLPTKWLLRHP